MTTALQVIDFAAREVGYTEQGGKGNNSGNITKYGAWFGFNGVSWCGIFVSYVLAMCGLPLRGAQTDKGFASCQLGMDWFKKMGLFIPTGKGAVLPGDIAFCHFQGEHAGANHTFIVRGAKPKSLLSIEGNTSAGNRGSQVNGGCVAERERPLAVILGVGRPAYSSSSSVAPKPQAGPAWPGRPLMLASPHMRGGDVKMIQAKMNGFGSKLVIDGDLGPTTSDAIRWWQHAFGLEPDGVAGAVTWHTFFAH